MVRMPNPHVVADLSLIKWALAELGLSTAAGLVAGTVLVFVTWQMARRVARAFSRRQTGRFDAIDKALKDLAQKIDDQHAGLIADKRMFIKAHEVAIDKIENLNGRTAAIEKHSKAVDERLKQIDHLSNHVSETDRRVTDLALELVHLKRK